MMQRHKANVRSISLSADGARLASGSNDWSICVWDETGALLRTIFPSDTRSYGKSNFPRRMWQVQLPTTNCRKLSTVTKTGVKLWNVDSGEQKNSLWGHMFAWFSPDGRTIATHHSYCRIVLVEVSIRNAREDSWTPKSC